MIYIAKIELRTLRRLFHEGNGDVYEVAARRDGVLLAQRELDLFIMKLEHRDAIKVKDLCDHF